MSRLTAKIGLVFALALGVGGMLPTETNAQFPTSRRNTSDARARNLLRTIRNNQDNFRASFDVAIQNVRLRGTESDNINQRIYDFERATNDFEAQLNARRATTQDVENILREASEIDRFLRQTRLGTRVDRDWSNVRLSLDSLAREYNINWNWNTGYGSNTTNNGNYPNDRYPTYPNDRNNYNARLTGTFRLDESRSERASDVADRAVNEVSSADRQRTREILERRLETPEMLAIDQRGQQITIASSRAPQYSFTADGRDKYETTDNGRQLRVRTTLTGNRLEVSTTGDRGNDYTVIFEPIEGGRTLRVERRLSTDFLNRTVSLQSYYTRSSDVAQLDIYENPNTGDNRYPNTTNDRRNGEFIVRNNTQLRATLDQALSTKEAKDGDRFSMTVQTPDEYRGAVIEGYVSGVQRTGKVTGKTSMTFNFESIRMRDGRTYEFAGFVESMRTVNGEEVKVNNEGRVTGENQGKTTATRGAAGAAIGAIIGAIAGGGKGAAIGAIIGAGAGAGSVYIEGREDLELGAGSDVYIRSSSPEGSGRR